MDFWGWSEWARESTGSESGKETEEKYSDNSRLLFEWNYPEEQIKAVVFTEISRSIVWEWIWTRAARKLAKTWRRLLSLSSMLSERYLSYDKALRVLNLKNKWDKTQSNRKLFNIRLINRGTWLLTIKRRKVSNQSFDNSLNLCLKLLRISTKLWSPACRHEKKRDDETSFFPLHSRAAASPRSLMLPSKNDLLWYIKCLDKKKSERTAASQDTPSWYARKPEMTKAQQQQRQNLLFSS